MVSVIIIIIFLSITPFIYWSFAENAAFEKAHISHIVFYCGFGKDSAIDPDIEIDLEISYPRGILVDGDPVKIFGIAVTNTSIFENVEIIDLVFQNGQAYPIAQDNRGITKPMSFTLSKSSNESRFEGNSTIVWNLVGTYYPEVYIQTLQNDGQRVVRHADTKDVAITVFPKTQLIQMTTNKVTLLLAFAAYLLSLIGAFNIIYNLWTKNPINQVINEENKNYTEKKDDANTINTISNEANKGIRIRKDPDKSSRRDCPEREK